MPRMSICRDMQKLDCSTRMRTNQLFKSGDKKANAQNDDVTEAENEKLQFDTNE